MRSVIPLLLGQEPSVGGASGFELFDLITRLGIAGVFIYLYYEERKERRASQDRERATHEAMTEMLERSLPVLSEATKTLDKSIKVQETLTERAATGRGPELTDLVEQVNALTDELRSERRRGG